VIEESPSTAIDGALRRQLGESSVLLAKAADYSNAGTMEFLLDKENRFYFLEMNTRLQVEHPVTEEVTGLDLVKQQIQIAEGNLLSFRQNEIRMRGHAIECRICAEDPTENFMPSTGRIFRYTLPEGKIRVENGFQEGDEVSIFYDSLMAKVISWGDTRSEAVAAMKRALADFAIVGVESTIPFCNFVLEDKDFLKGNIDTRFVDKHFTPDLLKKEDGDQKLATAIAAVLMRSHDNGMPSASADLSSDSSRWKESRREVFR
jgi:acetyl/propionyl-CoA carboxylase alpha subunit